MRESGVRFYYGETTEIMIYQDRSCILLSAWIYDVLLFEDGSTLIDGVVDDEVAVHDVIEMVVLAGTSLEQLEKGHDLQFTTSGLDV